jgi:RNA polymerase sigma factor (sigma-70 family)
MALRSDQLAAEESLVQRCRLGDTEALATLRQDCQDALTHILLSRGANPTETEDLLADLWGECVSGADDRPSLLEKFSGRCSLRSWLATVATNRWIDMKRRQERRGSGPAQEADESPPEVLERLATTSYPTKEETLLNLLRECLAAGFAQCPPDALVLLKLVYLHHLTQREIVRMLGWSESKVSRVLSQAMRDIEQHTLHALKQRDPWLELTWQDFVDLCETQQIGFV